MGGAVEADEAGSVPGGGGEKDIARCMEYTPDGWKKGTEGRTAPAPVLPAAPLLMPAVATPPALAPLPCPGAAAAQPQLPSACSCAGGTPAVAPEAWAGTERYAPHPSCPTELGAWELL